MSRTYLACGALAALAVSSSLVAAQQAPQGESRAAVRAQAQTTVQRSSLVIGAAVSLKGGDRVGKIEDLIIDEGGCISMVVVTYGEHYVAVPWSVAQFDFGQRALVLDIERARFAQVPTFTEFSVFAGADFRRRVDTFFGVRQRDGERPRGERPGRDETPRPKAAPGTAPSQPGTPTPGKAAPGATPKQPGATPGTPSPKPTSPGGTQPPRKGQPTTPGTKPGAPKGDS